MHIASNCHGDTLKHLEVFLTKTVKKGTIVNCATTAVHY